MACVQSIVAPFPVINSPDHLRGEVPMAMLNQISYSSAAVSTTRPPRMVGAFAPRLVCAETVMRAGSPTVVTVPSPVWKRMFAKPVPVTTISDAAILPCASPLMVPIFCQPSAVISQSVSITALVSIISRACWSRPTSTLSGLVRNGSGKPRRGVSLSTMSRISYGEEYPQHEVTTGEKKARAMPGRGGVNRARCRSRMRRYP